MRPRLAVLSLLSIALIATTSTAQEAVADPVMPKLSAIDAAMQSYVDQGQISGAVTLVGHEGKVVHISAVGAADIAAQQEMKPWFGFAIASMSKPITSTGLLILQDEGKLSVDDKISKYIPSFSDLKLANGEAPERELTIRDAITHTSGLSGSQTFSGSLADHVEQLAQRPLAFQPGAKWKYSPGVSVAGRIIEIVSEQPLEDFLQERIFEPLGMKRTTFYPDAKQQRTLAKIYMPGDDDQSLVVAGNRISDYKPENGPNPSGGLVSNARDLFRFYQMILAGGKFRGKRIVSQESVDAMTSPQTGDLVTGFTPGNCWGLGWCIVREPQGVTERLSSGTYGHGGAFGTQGWVDPETETIFVLLIQRTKLPNSDGSEIRKTFHQVATDAINRE